MSRWEEIFDLHAPDGNVSVESDPRIRITYKVISKVSQEDRCVIKKTAQAVHRNASLSCKGYPISRARSIELNNEVENGNRFRGYLSEDDASAIPSRALCTVSAIHVSAELMLLPG